VTDANFARLVRGVEKDGDDPIWLDASIHLPVSG
jgi:hypothetical protein